MASPQTENGYTKIANELLEALARFRMPGEARQVFDVILRKTYGFNKPDDRIAVSQLAKETGLYQSSVCRALNKLRAMNIISENANKKCITRRINKDYETWKQLAKTSIVSKKDTAKKIKKHKPKKETNPDIKTFIDAFYVRYMKKVGTKYHVTGGKDGKAVERLLKTFSLADLLGHMETFFKSDDAFTSEAGYTIGVFASQINKIAGGQYGKGLDRITLQINAINKQLQECEVAYQRARTHLNEWKGTDKEGTQAWHDAKRAYSYNADEIERLKRQIQEIKK